MKRLLLNILSVFLVVLSAAMALLWIRSYHAADICSWHCRDMKVGPEDAEWYTQSLAMVSSGGVVVLNHESVIWERTFPNYQKPLGDWHWEFGWVQMPTLAYDMSLLDGSFWDPSLDSSSWATRHGIDAWDQERRIIWTEETAYFTPTRNIGFSLPHWLLVMLTAAMPVTRLCRRYLQRRRSGGGLCANCGYDLRATPERCPECGMLIVAKDGEKP